LLCKKAGFSPKFCLKNWLFMVLGTYGAVKKLLQFHSTTLSISRDFYFSDSGGKVATVTTAAIFLGSIF
jgi:hypothetical protein